MGEGDTGASKKGGYAAEDQFSRLEAILENVYIRQQGLKKLQQHKAKTEAARRYPGEVDGTAKVQDSEQSYPPSFPRHRLCFLYAIYTDPTPELSTLLVLARMTQFSSIQHHH
jgi:hypothetical protein